MRMYTSAFRLVATGHGFLWLLAKITDLLVYQSGQLIRLVSHTVSSDSSRPCPHGRRAGEAKEREQPTGPPAGPPPPSRCGSVLRRAW
ncbi:hypothetical protein T492DRAFT_1110052, partial [Pavlovales sp. CCMP2436]